MGNPVIKVENLSKIYKLYNKPVDRLKESLGMFGKQYHKDFYALSNITFEVNKGETIGIIGKNGSGKSTLLKIITGIIAQSSGTIDIRGKISALLELGAGFNPEYTGLENIYLNGTIMGYSKEEVDAKLDDILTFADIGDFIHQRVKMYSSGMFARLAFAVAISVDPDVLIVDEALSVGDAFFQNKCFHKFESFRKAGKTILFVSHDIGSVKRFCSKVIWLNNGIIEAFGDKDEVCAMYMNNQIKENNIQVLGQQNLFHVPNCSYEVEDTSSMPYKVPCLKNVYPSGGTGQAEIISFFITNSKNEIISMLSADQEFTFHMVVKFIANIENILFGFFLEDAKGIKVLGLNSVIYKHILPCAKKDEIYEATFTLKMPKMQKGEYVISPAVSMGTQEEHVILCWYHNIVSVTMDNPGYNLSIIELYASTKIIRHLEKDLDLSN